SLGHVLGDLDVEALDGAGQRVLLSEQRLVELGPHLDGAPLLEGGHGRSRREGGGGGARRPARRRAGLGAAGPGEERQDQQGSDQTGLQLAHARFLLFDFSVSTFQWARILERKSRARSVAGSAKK